VSPRLRRLICSRSTLGYRRGSIVSPRLRRLVCSRSTLGYRRGSIVSPRLRRLVCSGPTLGYRRGSIVSPRLRRLVCSRSTLGYRRGSIVSPRLRRRVCSGSTCWPAGLLVASTLSSFSASVMVKFELPAPHVMATSQSGPRPGHGTGARPSRSPPCRIPENGEPSLCWSVRSLCGRIRVISAGISVSFPR
jgi:hypothetical protein